MVMVAPDLLFPFFFHSRLEYPANAAICLLVRRYHLTAHITHVVGKPWPAGT
jgi:hypothetical protein